MINNKQDLEKLDERYYYYQTDRNTVLIDSKTVKIKFL